MSGAPLQYLRTKNHYVCNAKTVVLAQEAFANSRKRDAQKSITEYIIYKMLCLSIVVSLDIEKSFLFFGVSAVRRTLHAYKTPITRLSMKRAVHSDAKTPITRLICGAFSV